MDYRSYAKTKLETQGYGPGGSWVEGYGTRSSDKRLKMSPRVKEGAGWNPTLLVPSNFQGFSLDLGFRGREWEKWEKT